MSAKSKRKIQSFHPEDVANFLSAYWSYYASLEEDYNTMIDHGAISFSNINEYASQIKLFLAVGSEIDVLLKVICQVSCPFYQGHTIKDHRVKIVQMVVNGDWDSIDKKVVHKSGLRVYQPWNDYDNERQSLEWWTMYNNVKHKRTFLDKQGNLFFKLITADLLTSSMAALYILEKQYLEYMMGYLLDSDNHDFQECVSTIFE